MSAPDLRARRRQSMAPSAEPQGGRRREPAPQAAPAPAPTHPESRRSRRKDERVWHKPLPRQRLQNPVRPVASTKKLSLRKYLWSSRSGQRPSQTEKITKHAKTTSIYLSDSFLLLSMRRPII
ncbi:uncharacterized protein N7529_010796 [Penicillium soppii]|uniref:uncharacterized protein n=1 Tax=Penicillium soppii TaxID=69789 RepID=UPI0025481C30|nr:uncharacterized protein N7529_010796 [Penicillium soppii]KAJ5851411.1 hypothetical protein N7529_010796 [Penicillium soppii]